MANTDTDVIFRGSWECGFCGETGSPPETLKDHLDTEHPEWRSLPTDNELENRDG